MSTGRIFWGLVLLVVGVFFLADNLGFLPFNPGLLWPVLIILLGIFIIFGARLTGGEGQHAQSLSVPLEDAKRASVKVEYGAGRIQVSGVADDEHLLSGDFHFLDLHTRREGDAADLRLSSRFEEFFFMILPWNWSAARREWDFALNPNIPLSLKFEVGASENHLDFRQLKVEQLELETGASSTELILPEAAGFSSVEISHGAASLDITVPPAVAASIRVESGLGSVDVDQTRFPRSNGRYVSPDYATAANKVEIHIETGVSSTTIR